MEISNLITLTKVSDGKDSSGFYLETNFEELTYAYDSNNGREFFPSTLEFTLKQENREIKFEGNFELEYIDENKIVHSLIDENYSDFYRFGQEAASNEVEDKVIVNPNTLFYHLQQLENNNSNTLPTRAILRFTYFQNNAPIFIKTYSIAPFTSDELARFALNAADVTAAVNGKAMKFSSAGLEIFQAGLTIYSDGNADSDTTGLTKVLYFDDGDLVLKGSIEASSGSFHGIIEATEGGNIGGFSIKSGCLESSVDENGNPYVRLDGEKGSIYAKNLTLGEGAEVETSIRLGSATLYNPEQANHKLLQSGATTIYDDGFISSGNIKIDGTKSKLYSHNDLTGAESWSLTPERAVFNNIIAKGEIESAVFKVNGVQAAGGAMIFRPSYKVVQNSVYQYGATIELGLEEAFMGFVQNTVWVVDDKNQYHEGIITNIKDKTILTIVLNRFVSLEEVFAVIDLGRQGFYLSPDLSQDSSSKYYCLNDEKYTLVEEDDLVFSNFNFDEKENLVASPNQGFTINENGFVVPEENQGDEDVEEPSQDLLVDENNNITLYEQRYYEYANPELLMGINSGTAPVNNVLYGRGLTLTTNERKIGELLPNLFLGDLTELGQQFSQYGYGLYADSVYLNGTLITKLEDDCYAGISTISNISANLDTDTSKIVFWAGAKSSEGKPEMDEEDIRNAPFYVTQNGTVYASQGRLSGSLFVGGEIRSADIYAAKIHGSYNEIDEPALTIYDTNKGRGISFKGVFETKGAIGEIETEEKETFSIDSKGLKTESVQFIQIDESAVNFIGDSFNTKRLNSDGNYLALESVSEKNQRYPALVHHQNNVQKCGFYFKNKETIFQLEEQNQTNQCTIWSVNGTKMIGQITFSDNAQEEKMQYRPVLNENNCIGYNLFIV